MSMLPMGRISPLFSVGEFGTSNQTECKRVETISLEV